MVKIAKIGVYGEKTRALQRRMSYEAVSMTWKVANVYRYLGSRDNPDPSLEDVQITTFMEVPDRAYADEPVPINIYFEPAPEQVADFSRFGIIDPIGGEQVMKVHINSYDDLGRPVVEGDVLEVPFFEQDSHRAFWEVTDVDRGQEFERYYAVLKLSVLEDKRETREIGAEGSIGPSLDDIMGDHEAHAEDYVPHEGVDDTVADNGETNDKLADEYDGRQPNRRSFLDDFDGDLV